MDFIREEERDLKNLFNRFRKRDFSGTGGQVIKNSSFQLTQSLVAKGGSLLFTVIIARLLMPEVFGLYSLALATIVLFGAFADLGIGSALITFISKSNGKKDYSGAKGYARKLFGWKIKLVLFVVLVLGLSSYFIANYYYQKPIFYAILAGILYIPAMSVLGFVEAMFKSENNFKIPLRKEFIFQILRLIFVPLVVLFVIEKGFTSEATASSVILAVAFSTLIVLALLVHWARKKLNFLKHKSRKLSKKENLKLWKFTLPLSTMVLSGVFFGYIDTLMLGRFVSESFIAFYAVAFSLVGSAAVIIGFTSTAVLPILSSKKGKSLESAFRKTRNFTLGVSILGGVFTYFAAYYIIRIIYGLDYLASVPVLKLFSLLIVVLPVISIYVSYYTSQEKTKSLAWLLVIGAILNIIFNIFGITYGLNNFGEMGAVYGACIATILSRFVYLGGLVVFRKK